MAALDFKCRWFRLGRPSVLIGDRKRIGNSQSGVSSRCPLCPGEYDVRGNASSAANRSLANGLANAYARSANHWISGVKPGRLNPLRSSRCGPLHLQIRDITNLQHQKIGNCQARRKNAQPSSVLKAGQLEVAPLQSYFRVGD